MAIRSFVLRDGDVFANAAMSSPARIWSSTSREAKVSARICTRAVTAPVQPEVAVVSASSGPSSAYVAGRSDGRLYRRLTRERWERVHDGGPESASTIAPLLCADVKVGELWAADERGVHRSDDGGKSWRRAVGYATSSQYLRGLALVQ
jgi:hypothetical protein